MRSNWSIAALARSCASVGEHGTAAGACAAVRAVHGVTFYGCCVHPPLLRSMAEPRRAARPSWTAASANNSPRRLRAAAGRHPARDHDALVAAFEHLFRTTSTPALSRRVALARGISKPDAFREIVNAGKADACRRGGAGRRDRKARRGIDGLARRAGRNGVLWSPGRQGVSIHGGKSPTTSCPRRQLRHRVDCSRRRRRGDGVESADSRDRARSRRRSTTARASTRRAAAAAAGVRRGPSRGRLLGGVSPSNVGTGACQRRGRPRRALGLHYIRDDVKFRRDRTTPRSLRPRRRRRPRGPFRACTRRLQ